MAKSKKKTLSQNVVNVATTGMPQPVKKVLGGRLVALLIVLCVPVLYATGIVTVKWENGRPRMSINQQRATQVKEQAVDRMEEMKGDRTPTVSIPPLMNRKSKESVSERIEGLKDDLSRKAEQGWN